MERSCEDGGVIADATSSEDVTNADSEFVEMDPTGRYGRYEEVLGKGAYKTVYKAFDDLDGIEVAWNQVKLQDMVHSGGDMDRLYSELHLLKTLKHKNIIKFYNSWVDTRNRSVNFITEIFTSGTLRQYRKKHKHVKLRAIKHWARQILQGLVYLHSHEPPIIHRDLKCDNIFINGNNGEVKIGDLGLATILRQAPAAHSVIGTPEFMAPELYEEHYNELVDIYSFGMCLLEMLTSEYPYSECANAAQIYKKVTTGRKPAALSKVRDPETRNFVEKCLASAPQRRHAKELLLDPFLRSDDDSETLDFCHPVTVNRHVDMKGLEPVPEETNSRFPQEIEPVSDVESHFSLLHSGGIAKCNGIVSDSPRSREAFKRSRDFKIKGRKQDEKKVLVRIRITSSRGGVRYIQFDFDVEADTAMSVASEMVTELELSDQDVTTIADMIDAEIISLIPDWKPGLSFDEPVDEVFVDEHQESVSEDSAEQHDMSEDTSVQDNHCTTLESSNDLQGVLGPRNDIFNTYGRFEEVGCTRSGSNPRQTETEGSEIFSDFSSEQLEGGGSESSLDGSLERSSIDIPVDNNVGSQIDVHLDGKQQSVDKKPGLENGYVNKDFLPLHVAEGEADDEDLSILLLQQDQKHGHLISKHTNPSSGNFQLGRSESLSGDRVGNDLRMDNSLLQVRTLEDSLSNQSELIHAASNHNVGGLENGFQNKASIPLLVTEGEVDDDAGSEDLRTLIQQQKHELQLLRSKHKQALLNLKMNLNRDAMVPGETLPTEGFGLPVQTSSYQDRNCQRIDNKMSPRSKDTDCPPDIHRQNHDNICKSTHASYQNGEIESSILRNQNRSINDCPPDVHRQNHDNILRSTQASYQNGESESNLLRNQNRSNGGGFPDTSKSNMAEKSQACCSNHSTTVQGECGSLRGTEAEGKHDDCPKLERDSLAKRESYLELYKGRSNLKDKPLKTTEAYSTSSNDGASTKDTDQEQLRKQQLQKSIADLEAKTLEGLLQSKSKYVAGAAVKSHISAAQSVQTGSSTAPGRPQQVTPEITKA